MKNQGGKKEENLNKTEGKGNIFQILKGKFFAPKETVLNQKAIISQYDEEKKGNETTKKVSADEQLENKNSSTGEESNELTTSQEEPTIPVKEKFHFSSMKNFSSKWQAPKILETNLIKNEVTTFIDWSKDSTVLGVAVGVALIIISLAYGGLIFFESSKEKQILRLDEEIMQIKRDIASEEEKVEKGLSFQKKLRAVEYILNNHIYWTNFFKFLEDNTYEEVVYTGFSGDTKGDYNLTANAKIGHYVAVDQVNKFLENKTWVKSAESLSSSIIETPDGNAVVSFTMSLKIKPDIFKKIIVEENVNDK